MLEEELNRICTALDLEVPHSDADKNYRFELPDGAALHLREDKKFITLHQPISKPLDESEEAQKTVMKALQFHWTRLKDHYESIAFDPDTKVLVLSASYRPQDLSEISLQKRIEDFLASLEFWKTAMSDELNGDSDNNSNRISV